MTLLGRRARLVTTAVVFGLLLLGTWRGDDDHFPFGPFRMYASTQSLDAPTSWLLLEADTADGQHIALGESDSGLRRAELEGQIGQLSADPSRLVAVATTYARRHPESSPLIVVELVQRSQPMRGGQPVGETTDDVIVRWSAE
jgi:hypothetical protein